MKTGKNLGLYGLAVLVISLAALFACQQAKAVGCGCMDVAFVIDDTGSMGGAISNVQSELTDVIAIANASSGGDLRMGLITFPSDNVVVTVPFTTSIGTVEAAIQALSASGGNGEPESSDTALQYAITGSTAASCTISNGPFGSFRPQCVKIAVLITDAHPGECTDTFTPGVSDVYAHNVAVQAASAGVLIASVFVPDEDPADVAVIAPIMQDYAVTSGGVYVKTAPDGSGAADDIENIIANCGTSGSSECITRDSRFWFTHAQSNDSSVTNCATLLAALTANGGFCDLGFIRLPVTYENSDNVIDVFDATMEAVGFYYESKSLTGELGNQQSEKLKGAKLCKARKVLSVELIAATANVRLLGTNPSHCTYSDGGVETNFPANLLQLAQAVAAGNNPDACMQMTTLLRKFNSSGANNNLPGNLVECSPNDKKTLKNMARDPTTQTTCPGINANCASAQAVYFKATNPPYSKAKFTGKASLANYPSSILSPPTAFWVIAPPTAAVNRQFTATASGNFQVYLRILTGTCTATDTNAPDSGLTEISVTHSSSNLETQVSFTTDGTNDFYIQAIPEVTSIPGKLKLTVKSP